MTEFVRTTYSVRLVEKDNPREYIVPQGVQCVYSMNSIPVARVDLAFGLPFGDSSDVDADGERLIRWAKERTMLLVEVDSEITTVGSRNTDEKTEVIFEGRIYVPSLQMLRQGAANSVQLQHWTGDLLLGSMLVSYALSGHPQQANASGIYNPSDIGSAGVVQMEGIAFRLGLPTNWQDTVANDIWANAQKPILAELAQKNFTAPLGLAISQCADEINKPASRAIEALQRIQGPSNTLGTPYSGGVVPLAIRSDLAADTRDLLSQGIAKSIGYAPISQYMAQTFWNKILGFCAEFGLVFVPRATDAAIVPFNVGSSSVYSIECDENDTLELTWSAFQQTNVRGIGILSSYHSDIGQASLNPDTVDLLPHGCHVGSTDPNRGMFHFVAPPRWLADLPPDSLAAQAATGASQVIGVHSPPVAGQEASELTVRSKDHRQSMQSIYNEYAKLRYLETELRGRQIHIGTHYRTDIAPGTMLQVRLREDHLISRLNLKLQSLVGVVTGLTLSLSKRKREPVASIVMDYGRQEDQVSDPELSIDRHPIFESDVSGLKLVD